MDSRTALERLDAVRPGSDDLALPEMAGVSDLLASDVGLAAEHRRRQSWERSVAVSMHDVPVPPGLKERLLAKLADSATVVEVAPTPRRHTRRRALGMVSGLAASVVAAGVYWFVVSNTVDPVTVAELKDAAAALASGEVQPEAFKGDFAPVLPSSGNWWRLRARPPVVGLLPSDNGHRAAAWQFSFVGRAGRLQGVLVAIPAESVASPPAGKFAYAGGNAVAWTEGDFVYVCRVEGSIHELLRQLDEAPLA